MIGSLRAEAVSLLRRFGRLPDLMELDDLVHAGWLGYSAAYPRARSNPHAYAMRRARGAMLDELYRWKGFKGRHQAYYLDIAKRDALRSRPSARVMGMLDTSEVIQVGDSFGRLGPVVARLPIREREVIEAHYREGQSVPVIAATQGVTDQTIYGLKHRSLNRLRKQLEAA